jgi:hypothetical protein
VSSLKVHIRVSSLSVIIDLGEGGMFRLGSQQARAVAFKKKNASKKINIQFFPQEKTNIPGVGARKEKDNGSVGTQKPDPANEFIFNKRKTYGAVCLYSMP